MSWRHAVTSRDIETSLHYITRHDIWSWCKLVPNCVSVRQTVQLWERWQTKTQRHRQTGLILYPWPLTREEIMHMNIYVRDHCMRWMLIAIYQWYQRYQGIPEKAWRLHLSFLWTYSKLWLIYWIGFHKNPISACTCTKNEINKTCMVGINMKS